MPQLSPTSLLRRPQEFYLPNGSKLDPRIAVALMNRWCSHPQMLQTYVETVPKPPPWGRDVSIQTDPPVDMPCFFYADSDKIGSWTDVCNAGLCGNEDCHRLPDNPMQVNDATVVRPVVCRTV